MPARDRLTFQQRRRVAAEAVRAALLTIVDVMDELGVNNPRSRADCCRAALQCLQPAQQRLTVICNAGGVAMSTALAIRTDNADASRQLDDAFSAARLAIIETCNLIQEAYARP
jgi:hypothetical protein